MTISENFWFGAKQNFNIKLTQKGLSLYTKNIEKIKNLKGDEIIFLDTNVLTDYYKISFKEREELKDIIKKHKGRIKITRQVEKEFLSNRTAIIRQFNGRLEESLVRKFSTVKKSIDELLKGKIKGFDDYINDKVIKSDFPELSEELRNIYDEFKRQMVKSLNESNLNDRILKEENKINEIIKKAIKENNEHEKKDKMLAILADIDIVNPLKTEEINFLKTKYQQLLELYNDKKSDNKVNWQYTFPGCGEQKGKTNPTGDFIIFHEIMAYLKMNNCSAIFLTNDITKKDWLDENQEQYTHYIESIYSNTNQMMYILDAKKIFNLSYEDVFKDKKVASNTISRSKSISPNNNYVLDDFEIDLMFAILENQNVNLEPVTTWSVNNSLKRKGFDNILINIASQKLKNEGFINIVEGIGYDGEIELFYELTANGRIWVLNNWNKRRKVINNEIEPINFVTSPMDLPF